MSPRRLALVVLLQAACSPSWKAAPHDRVFQREPPRKLHAPPEPVPQAYWWERAEKTTVRPLGRALSPGRYVTAAMGGREAADINAFGQVPDSGWFKNRVGLASPGDAEVALGATGAPPAAGALQILSFELKGASPRFVVLDSAGASWTLKADSPAHPGVSTSAEIISARLLWLAGYHVPEMHLVDLDVNRLKLAKSAWTRSRYDEKTPMTARSFRTLIAHLNPDIDGTARVLAVRHPDGVGIGPFRFEGRRSDDPNDRIPHQHRRSLRGLWLFFSWLNITDARGKNTLDVHRALRPDGHGAVRHYLKDFADAFGAADSRPKDVSEGWIYLVDWREMGLNLVTLGLRYPDWLRPTGSPYLEVGLFAGDTFDPASWKPRLPNPAFHERTDADLFWAASILARIDGRYIRAAVEAGGYRQPGTASYVAKTLIERRTRLLRYAFAGHLPLDRPRTRQTTLLLDDLRPQARLEPTALGWRARWNRTRGIDEDLGSGVVQSARIDLEAVVAAALRRRGFADDPFVTVIVAPATGGPALSVHLRVVGPRQLVPVALER